MKDIIVCKVCGKKENITPWRDENWYIEYVPKAICSKECFDKRIKQEDKDGRER